MREIERLDRLTRESEVYVFYCKNCLDRSRVILSDITLGLGKEVLDENEREREREFMTFPFSYLFCFSLCFFLDLRMVRSIKANGKI